MGRAQRSPSSRPACCAPAQPTLHFNLVTRGCSLRRRRAALDSHRNATGARRMRNSHDHILTSHVGSLPRPDDLIEANRKRDAGEGTDEAGLPKTVAGGGDRRGASSARRRYRRSGRRRVRQVDGTSGQLRRVVQLRVQPIERPGANLVGSAGRSAAQSAPRRTRAPWHSKAPRSRAVRGGLRRSRSPASRSGASRCFGRSASVR